MFLLKKKALLIIIGGEEGEGGGVKHIIPVPPQEGNIIDNVY